MQPRDSSEDQPDTEAHTRVAWRRSGHRHRESLEARRGGQRLEYGIEAARSGEARTQLDGTEVEDMALGTPQEGLDQETLVDQYADVAHADATRMLVAHDPGSRT